MLSKLKTTLRGWVGRYGSEAAFVGRVALAALLPPGCDRLLAHGLEAAFEYLQGKSDVISDQDLLEHLDRLGVPHGELEEIVSRVDQDGQVALNRVYQARQVGISERDVTEQLRELIACDPTLNALQTSLSHIAEQLTRLEAQGETLIAGQQYQTAAIEEMMAMMRAIATQVGLETSHLTDASTSRAPTSPSPSRSPSEQLMGLSALGSTKRADQSLDGLLSSDLLRSHQGASHITSPLERLNDHEMSGESGEALDLVARFRAQQRERAQTSHLDQGQAVALVQRFQEQVRRRQESAGPQESPQAGQGRVALTLIEVGHDPIKVVKWLCEEWGYPLPDAIIVTQSAPCVVRRDDNFVLLGRARSALEGLGAQVRLKV